MLNRQQTQISTVEMGKIGTGLSDEFDVSHTAPATETEDNIETEDKNKKVLTPEYSQELITHFVI